MMMLSAKQEEHLMEVLEHAVSDPRLPARHVLLGGGTPLEMIWGSFGRKSLHKDQNKIRYSYLRHDCRPPTEQLYRHVA